MKLINIRRSRLIKLVLASIAVVLTVAFFLPGPKSKEQLLKEEHAFALQFEPQVESDVRKADHNDEEGPLPEFKEGVLGNFESVAQPVKAAPGEGGKPHHVSDRNLVSNLMMQYGMNIAVSDEISPNRTVPDQRLEECKYWQYPTDLPHTSVVVVFHNEGLSVLMRTVHSVINRSPPQFLHEVVLVDDFSDKENLKGELETYIARNFPVGKVRLIRNAERQGLIRSRSFGAEQSRGDVVLFLDAHCEVGPNWLPPLLAPIRANRRTMTVPVIDGIDKDTFEIRPVYHSRQHFRGIFEWGMLYKEIEIPQQEIDRRKHFSEPYKSPTHAGGLFAMDRKYFLELGGYDPGLLVWGGENFELSFKIWQCGGRILWVPCSRVGHVYRGFMPYSFGKLAHKRNGPLITINYKRVVEVWMDEYKQYFYTREPMAVNYEAGDISKQLELRNRLQCKPFSWFMKEVAYDVVKNFPYLPRNLFWGEVKSSISGMCLDPMTSSPPSTVHMQPCHGSGGNQVLRLNAEGQLGVGERCIDAHADEVRLVYCKLGTVDGPWSYDVPTKQLRHRRGNKVRCVTYNIKENTVTLETCSDEVAGQRFTFHELRV